MQKTRITNALKMKDLEAASGINRETIRFYIREGLLPEPQRPKRNVANYGEEHVVRLRLIRRLQTERFLPLNVIKTIIQTAEMLPETPGEAFIGIENKVFPLLTDSGLSGARTLAQASNESGVPEHRIRELVDIGFLCIGYVDEEATLNSRNNAILRLWKELQMVGFTSEAGFTNEHWQAYSIEVNAIVEREAELFAETVLQTAALEDASSMAARGIQIVNEIIPLMRLEALVRRAGNISVN